MKNKLIIAARLEQASNMKSVAPFFEISDFVVIAYKKMSKVAPPVTKPATITISSFTCAVYAETE